MAKKVFVSVTNNLVTDQRVHRTCLTLKEMGCEPVLVGRNFPRESMEKRAYPHIRLSLLFKKGFLFYAAFNFRLFCKLLFKKADLFLANDADTLPANFLLALLKRKPLVVDCHEYFTEVPELKDRGVVKRFWLGLEKYVLPKADLLYTVSNAVSDAYRRNMGLEMAVIKNVPSTGKNNGPVKGAPALREHAGQILVIYQGAVNQGRGLEIAIEAMQLLDDNYRLAIVGKGDLYEEMKSLAREKKVERKVDFYGRVPFEKLHAYTRQADMGISIEDLSNPSYQWALPNKFFDYLAAGKPVIITPHKETEEIVVRNSVGLILRERNAQALAAKIKELSLEIEKDKQLKDRCLKVAGDYSWEKEKEKLKKLLKPFV